MGSSELFSKSASRLNNSAGDQFSNSTSPSEKYGFLRCLSYAQSRHVDFIGITWQGALGMVGKGGQGDIYQSAVSLGDNFAFKRSAPADGSAPPDSFRDLCSEILVLGCRDIQQHPNIINLEGICWEVKKEKKFYGFGPEVESIWPVLLFEKALHGDLEKFMRSEYGAALDVRDRMQICAEIGSAIKFLHASSVVHGDIKPKNTLVFGKTSPFTPKLTDFGYSTIASGKNLIFLPRSEPWDAPEYHERGFTFAEAKKLEVFSFGTLCFWVIYREKLEAMGKDMPPKVESFLSRSLGQLGAVGGFQMGMEVVKPDIKALKKLKGEGTMENFALECVEADARPSESQKQNLKRVFKSTLDFEAENRHSDLEEVVRLLGQDSNLDMPPVPGVPSESQIDFQVSKSLQSLCQADYRVRKHVFNCLKDHYLDCDLSEERQMNTAFQIAFCTKIGFGTSKDEASSMEWLEKSGHNLHDLQREIDMTRLDTEIFNSRFRQLYHDGIIMPINFALEYRDSKDLEPTEKRLRNEIEGAEEVLGKTHRAVLNLKSTHISILRDMGHGDLLRVLQHTLDALAADPQHGPEGFDTLMLRGDLGAAQVSSKMIEEGGANILQAYEGMKRIRGDDHMTTLLIALNLAHYTLSSGQAREGVALARSTLSGFTKILGQLHPHTMGIKGVLQQHLMVQGKLEESEIVQRDLLKDHLAALGPNDLHTIGCSEMLIGLLIARGKFEEAEKENQINLDKLTKKERENHPHILKAREVSADIYLKQGKYKDAADQFLSLQREVRPWPPNLHLVPKNIPNQPGAYPNDPVLISLRIKHATALQAQALSDESRGYQKVASDGFKEARKSIQKVLADFNKVFGKYTSPDIGTGGGLDGSALHNAMAKGDWPSLDLLVSVGVFGERKGIHYKEAIAEARDKKFTNIVAILEEHQLLCGGANIDATFKSLRDLRSFINGSWGGSYLYGNGGARKGNVTEMTFSLHCKENLERPETLVVEGNGKNDIGEVVLRGESSISGQFTLICSREGQETDFGWRYAGYFNTSRKAMGGHWGLPKAAMPEGTFFFYKV